MVSQTHSIKIQQRLALVQQHFLHFHACIQPILRLRAIFLNNECVRHLSLCSRLSSSFILTVTSTTPLRRLGSKFRNCSRGSTSARSILCQLLITRQLVWYACPLGGDWLIQWCQQWPVITLTLTLGYYTSVNLTTQGACISNTPGCYLINRSHLSGETLKANTLACDPQL